MQGDDPAAQRLGLKPSYFMSRVFLVEVFEVGKDLNAQVMVTGWRVPEFFWKCENCLFPEGSLSSGIHLVKEVTVF